MSNPAVNPSHYKDILFIPKDLLRDYIDEEGNLSLQYMEVMQFILTEEEFKGHLKGQVFKYLLRIGKKDNIVQEAEKSNWYGGYIVKWLKQLDLLKRIKK